jgi:transposase
VRVGMEATGYSRWFERLLAELGIEVWIGDAAEIKTKRVRKQKTDREDSASSRETAAREKAGLDSRAKSQAPSRTEERTQKCRNCSGF